MSFRVACATAMVTSLLGTGANLHSAGPSAKTPTGQSQAPELTSGAVALLGNTLDDPALEQLRRALSADDPNVRAVAARLAGVTAQGPLVTSLASSWEQEKDPIAAAEQARSLLLILGAKAAKMVEARLDPATSLVYADWVVRNHPEQFADIFPRLRAAFVGDSIGLTSYAVAMLRVRPDLAEQVLRVSLVSTTPATWRVLLDRLPLDVPSPGRDQVLIDALASEDEDTRTATVWALVSAVADSRTIAPTVLDAAQAKSNLEAPLTWERLGREILARRIGARATPDRSAFLLGESTKHIGDSRVLASIKELLPTEQRALQKALGENYPRSMLASGPRPPTAVEPAMRTMPTLWPGVFKSLVDEAKCRNSSPLTSAVAVVTYRADGTVGSATAPPESLSAGCANLFNALVRLTIADAAYSPPSGRQEVLVLPLGEHAVACTTRGERIPNRPIRLGGAGGIKPPRKVRDVPPIYPKELVQRGVEGLVTVESTIAETGCVSGAKIVRSVNPQLDLAAIVAVSGWEFTPTTVDGRSVPVAMTVSVNFTTK